MNSLVNGLQSSLTLLYNMPFSLPFLLLCAPLQLIETLKKKYSKQELEFSDINKNYCFFLFSLKAKWKNRLNQCLFVLNKIQKVSGFLSKYKPVFCNESETMQCLQIIFYNPIKLNHTSLFFHISIKE